MRAHGHAAALVWFLEQFGGRQRTLRPQWLVVLLPEARETLHGAGSRRRGAQITESGAVSHPSAIEDTI